MRRMKKGKPSRVCLKLVEIMVFQCVSRSSIFLTTSAQRVDFPRKGFISARKVASLSHSVISPNLMRPVGSRIHDLKRGFHGVLVLLNAFQAKNIANQSRFAGKVTGKAWIRLRRSDATAPE